MYKAPSNSLTNRSRIEMGKLLPLFSPRAAGLCWQHHKSQVPTLDLLYSYNSYSFHSYLTLLKLHSSMILALKCRGDLFYGEYRVPKLAICRTWIGACSHVAINSSPVCDRFDCRAIAMHPHSPSSTPNSIAFVLAATLALFGSATSLCLAVTKQTENNE